MTRSPGSDVRYRPFLCQRSIIAQSSIVNSILERQTGLESETSIELCPEGHHRYLQMARAFPLASFVFRPVNTFPSCISLNSIGMRNTQQCKKLEYPDQNFDDFRKLLKLQPQVFLSIMKNASLLAESFDRMLILVVIFITSTESFLCTIFFYGFLARDVLEIFGVKIKQQ